MAVVHFFLFTSAMIGIFVLCIAYYIYTQLDRNCGSIKELETYINIYIYIGASLIALSIGYTTCVNSCDCDEDGSEGKKIFSFINMVFTGVLTIISVLMINKLKNCTTTDLTSLPKAFSGILGSLFLFYIIYFVTQFRT